MSTSAPAARDNRVRSVRVDVLGPLTVTVDGEAVPLGPLKQRVLLAILLCHQGAAVPSGVLIDALWDGDPPASAAANVRQYVHALRRVLGPDVISGSGRPGYRLDHDRVSTDLAEFDRLCAAAEAAAARHDFVAARDRLAAAVALRRDRAYADVGDRPAIADEVRGVEERWLLAMHRFFDAELRLGRAAESVGELTRLTTDHPYQERFWAQLMLALYQAQRQSDALAAYRRARRILHDELGIEPGPALRAMQRRILDADPVLSGEPPAAGAPAPRPAQLPLEVRGYVTRDREQGQLDAVLAGSHRRPAATVIAVVCGPAGVGKTALAVHWSHRVAGRFPDGQLYLNLRGFDWAGERLGAGDALQELLGALGVAPVHVPARPAARAALYRSTLAGRRMLIVLDNARDDDQVRPLLPGAPGCMVVVSSRNQLSGLVATEGAHPVVLDVLDVATARQVLAERIGADRLRAEPRAADEIIDRCARLPLALAVVAARAATHPEFRLGALARELAEVTIPLDAFGGPDPASDIRAVFSWSYHALSAAAARMFRLIGLHVGPHLTTAAAASLAGLPVSAARPVLAELARAHLLTEFRPGRYTFHDLLRAYAVELVVATEDVRERAAVIRRMLDHYLRTAQLAAARLRPHRAEVAVPSGVTPEDLTGRREALAWFAVEHPVLLGVIALCHRRSDGRPRYPGLVTYDLLSEHREAINAYLRASELYRDPDADRYAEATTFKHLGDAYAASDDHDAARRVWKQALVILEELGHVDADLVRAKIDPQ